MERLIRTLARLITDPGRKRQGQARDLQVDLGGAPLEVCALAQAMATHSYNIYLGEFSMFEHGESGAVSSLLPVIQLAAERGGIDLASFLTHGGPGGAAYDPAKTLELGADGGGMSYLGVGWSGGRVGLLVVEFDDPIEENLLMHFESAAQFLAFLDYKSGGEELPDLEALRAAVA